jgi:hypothetical protein
VVVVAAAAGKDVDETTDGETPRSGLFVATGAGALPNAEPNVLPPKIAEESDLNAVDPPKMLAVGVVWVSGVFVTSGEHIFRPDKTESVVVLETDAIVGVVVGVIVVEDTGDFTPKMLGGGLVADCEMAGATGDTGVIVVPKFAKEKL